GAALIPVLVFLEAKDIILGQQDDPSEIFLKAYLSAQQGEKLERENRFKTALAKYRFAGSLIETLRRSHADWQPAIVEYRGRKIRRDLANSGEDDETKCAKRRFKSFAGGCPCTARERGLVRARARSGGPAIG